MQYTDWGGRASRWSGIRSETVDVHGTKVHYLVTDQTRTSEVPVHLLVPNPANSASNWLDVLAELRPHAHAVAVDLPGTIAGHTALPGLAIVAPVARVLLRVSGRRILAEKLRLPADPASIAGSRWNTGGDLTRMSPEIAGLMRDEMSAVEPTRLGSAVTVYASLMSLMLVRRRPVLDAMRRVASPTLLVWGDEDRLTPRASIDDWTAQRPDWNLVVLHRVGHAPPFEVPADYARTVIDWCGPRVHDR